MTNDVLKSVPKKEARRLLLAERALRASGSWGPWETLPLLPGQVGSGGWASTFTACHRNRVFAVLDRRAEAGVRHLAVSSLSGIRPTWPEMQRIKDELAGAAATAIEVYPPKAEVIDQADMFHIWVLRGKLPFGLHKGMYLPGLRNPVIVQ
ncbi:MAG: DUF7694 domain-containing protein [Beijerinckiaceae bacterium]